MAIRKLTDDLSVAPQISTAEVAEIASQGFKSIICNRPDGEAADQPPFSEIAQAAADAGLQIRYVPVQSGKVTDGNADDFGEAMGELPKPVLAYCRSGTRSAMLWTMLQDRKSDSSDSH